MKRVGPLGILFAGMTVIAGCMATAPESAAYHYPVPEVGNVAPAEPQSSAQIYMFRGGFNGIFSTGITEMADELRRNDVPVHNMRWSSGSSSLEEIREAVASNPEAGPIILAGHSLGASTAMSLARKLTQDGIRVDLVILFDPLYPSEVPKGVRKLIDYKASGDKSNPGRMRPGKGFDGQIVNVDIRNLPNLDNSSHWNIVNQKALQNRVVGDVEQLYRSWQAQKS